MIEISYAAAVAGISFVWLAVRSIVWARQKKICWRREVELLLVYICLIVVTRFTFFPFGRVDGRIAPLLFDTDTMWPPRYNLKPLIYLADYPTDREILLNFIGNVAMFIPIGIIWPAVFRRLNTRGKVIAAGVGLSVCIEILQMPFCDRVSDVDDLILNSLGFLMGYGIYLLVKHIKKAKGWRSYEQKATN